MAKDLLVCAENGTEETISHKIEELEVLFENAPNALDAGRKFIQSFVDELNLRYRTHLTTEVPPELQKDLLVALDLYESSTPVVAQSPSQEISDRTGIAQIKLRIYPPWQWNFFGLNKSKPSKTKHTRVANTHVAKTPGANAEFELPGKMAVGFACALAGALVSIIPGGQGVGVWMIAAGATLALDGLSEGERPYYRNMNTGEIIPLSKPN